MARSVMRNGAGSIMNIGAARITLRVSHSRSLKDKRRVVNSLRQRTRSKFNVGIAEVELNDALQTLTLGIVCVSNSAVHAAQMVDRVVEFIEYERPDAEVVDCETEIIGF